MSTGLDPTERDPPFNIAGLSTRNPEWVIDFSRFREAWAIPPKPGGKAKGEGIYIAHPDTGTSDHPELPELTSPRYRRDLSKNFYESGRAIPGSLPGTYRWEEHDVDDDLRGPFRGHGTSTATVIMSARGYPDGTVPAPTVAFDDDEEDPKAFVSGVVPEARVIPFRVANSVLLSDRSDNAIADSIWHCITLQRRNPPDRIDVAVMSISLARPRFSVEDKIKEALQAARVNGIVICAAAGQLFRFQKFKPAFPASDPNVICVGACTDTHAKFKKGFYGPAMDITAPGVNVWRGQARRKRGSPVFRVHQSEGTSYAAAITAGACALWQAHWGREYLKVTYGPEWICALFRHCLKSSADTRGDTWNTAEQGAGVLDAKALLEFELPDKAFIESLGETRR